MKIKLIKQILKIIYTEYTGINILVVCFTTLLGLMTSCIFNMVFGQVFSSVYSTAFKITLGLFSAYFILTILYSYYKSVHLDRILRTSEYTRLVLDRVGLTEICIAFPYLFIDFYTVFNSDILASHLVLPFPVNREDTPEQLDMLNYLLESNVKFTDEVSSICMKVINGEVYLNPLILSKEYKFSWIELLDIVVSNSDRLKGLDEFILCNIRNLNCNNILYNANEYLYFYCDSSADFSLAVNLTSKYIEKDKEIIDMLYSKNSLLKIA